jgi:hypothetical protein
MVAVYLFRSANTGASCSRERSSCDGLGILCVHVDHEVRICGEKGHLTFRIATISAVCIGLDELPDREAVRGFARGDRDVLAHKLVSLFDSFPRGKTVTLVARKKSRKTLRAR